MPRVLKKRITHGAEGKRLDSVVTLLFPHLSRSRAQRLIQEGSIEVDGRQVRCSHRARIGEEVVLVVSEPETSVLEPEPIPLDILFEDRYIVVVNKSAGLVVHPGAGVRSGTLANALLAHCNDLSGIGGILRPGIVHRLDKGTTGLLVAAKTDQAHLGLAHQIAERQVGRKYSLVVWGILGEGSGRIEAPISRDRRHRKKMRVDWGSGRKAVTCFSVLERFSFASYVLASLETGRTHQVRVHFSQLGHPILGDPQYGGRTKAVSMLGSRMRKTGSYVLQLIQRPALHAGELSFRHPMSGEHLCFQAPLPPDMVEVLEALRTSF